MANCYQSSLPATDNTPLPCDGEYILTDCVTNPSSLPFLNLTVNSSQTEVNNAIVSTLINISNEIGYFTDEDLEIDGTYTLSEDDNGKYYYVTSAINDPLITINSELPDGFKCYFFYQPAPYNPEVDTPEALLIDAEVTTSPLFTVPEQNRVRITYYGAAYIKKKNTNLYTATGDLDVIDL